MTVILEKLWTLIFYTFFLEHPVCKRLAGLSSLLIHCSSHTVLILCACGVSRCIVNAVCLSDEEILIEHLHPSTSYVFQVRARNEVGVGLQKRITVTTDDVRKCVIIVYKLSEYLNEFLAMFWL